MHVCVNCLPQVFLTNAWACAEKLPADSQVCVDSWTGVQVRANVDVGAEGGLREGGRQLRGEEIRVVHHAAVLLALKVHARFCSHPQKTPTLHTNNTHTI